MQFAYPPFTTNQSEQIASFGESKLLEKIKEWLGETTPKSPHGMGDDCALLTFDSKKEICITTDAISYGQHVDATLTPYEVGAKLINRNLSDLAAMGTHPHSAVLAILSGPDLAFTWLEDFFYGARNASETYGLKIVGGDLSTLDKGQFSAVLTLTGQCAHPKLRTTAKLNAPLYVTGVLGGSILGKHYQFQPRLAEGAWLAAQADVHALMDITDGIGKDLQAFLNRTFSAELNLSAIPISEAAEELALNSHKDALEHAFCDGEDYELLFALAPETNCEDFESRWNAQFPNLKLSKIGTLIPKHTNGVFIDANTKEGLKWTHGYQHWNADV